MHYYLVIKEKIRTFVLLTGNVNVNAASPHYSLFIQTM